MSIYEQVLLALCAWREARGEPTPAQKGVIHSILNRVAKPGWWGNSIASVILHHAKNKIGVDVYQYTSFDPKDPNSTKLPVDGDTVWPTIISIAQEPGEDPTNGATNYYSTDIPEPEWAAQMTCTASIGALKFYR